MKRGIRKVEQSYYCIAEIAKRWRVSESTIRRMIKNNIIKVTWFGGSIRISIEEIHRHELS